MTKIIKLKNSLPLLVVPMTGTKTVTTMMVIGTGSKYETRKNNGISHFLEHMFFKGTKKRPDTMAISSELDAIGADYNAFTGKEYTGYWIKTQREKVGLAFDMISDMLLNSKFDSKEIEREKGVIIEEVNMYLDNPMYYIEDVFEQLLYNDTPAGWDTLGTKENIKSFKRKDFLAYLNSQYGAHNSFLCAIGNVAGLDIEKLAARHFANKTFSDRDKKFAAKEKTLEKQSKPEIKLHYKKTDQAHLSLGVRAYAYPHDENIRTKMLAIILGGSMSSRLFINLRERSGLCYYVRCSQETYTDTGYLVARAGVPVGKIDQAVRIILQEYKKLKTTLVPAGELKRVKDYIAGKMAINFEQSDSLANWYARQAVMAEAVRRETGQILKIETPEEHLKSIGAITSADLQGTARKIFVNQGLNLAMIGPFRDGKRFEKIIKL